MRTRLLHLWEVVTTGYWFVPALMMMLATILAATLLFLDRRLGDDFGGDWLYAGGPEGARTLLSAVAGSVITVAGVVFSITIAALTQASAQFGPRLLRNFMRDTGNQVVLGTFVSTFLYCLLVLRTVRGDADDIDQFIPNASVTAAVLLAVASIVVLIYFIHHVSVSLAAPTVVSAVLADLEEVVKRLPDIQSGTSAARVMENEQQLLPADFDATAVTVCSNRQGYVQAIDYPGLVALAEKQGLMLRLKYRPGDYLIKGVPLLQARPAERCPAEICSELNSAFICGPYRTAEQDVEHAIRQIVELAVRALSPGINDPFTAINCIDALGAGLCLIARRGLPGPLRFDSRGSLRLVTPVTTMVGAIDAAFHQVRQYGRDSVAVTLRLLEIIALCAHHMRERPYREALFRHAEMIYRQGQEALPDPSDRADVQERWLRAVDALELTEAIRELFSSPVAPGAGAAG